MLDCTSGWAIETDWQGVPLVTVLRAAGVQGDGDVVVRSTTGWATVVPAGEGGLPARGAVPGLTSCRQRRSAPSRRARSPRARLGEVVVRDRAGPRRLDLRQLLQVRLGGEEVADLLDPLDDIADRPAVRSQVGVVQLSQVIGADTGAPAAGRTAYGATSVLIDAFWV